MQYVYILACKDNSTYIGCTDDLKERIERHSKGYVPATKPLLPVKLITYFAFSNKYSAFNFEKYLKSGSGRAFTKKHGLSNSYPPQSTYNDIILPCLQHDKI